MNLDLLKYFLYLRDVSHKIAVTSNWEKSLKQKNNKNHKPVIQLGWEDCELDLSKYGKKNSLKEINAYLSSFSDKEAFLGIGSIVGTVNKKQICGSLFNIPIKYQINEINNKIEDVSLDIDNLKFNHQLLLSFFEFNDNNLFSELFPLVMKIKEFLKENELNDPDNPLKNIEILKDIIKDSLDVFFKSKNIVINKENTYSTLSEKYQKIKNAPVLNLENLFVFAFEVPSGISTWKYLNDFCSEIRENEKIDSEVLNSILSGDEKQRKEIDFDNEIFSLIPLSLSEMQKESIKYALNDTVSYIQGPPGTGKSHTISALAMMGLLLNKKILIVSQKPTALQVIKNKLDVCFNEMIKREFVPYIYFDKSNKRLLKNNLEKFINKNKNNTYSDISKLHEELEEFHHRLSEDLDLNNSLTEKINKELDKQYVFSKLNIEYQNKAENIDKEIKFKEKKVNISPLREDNVNYLNEVKNITCFYKNNKGLSRFLENKLNKLNNTFNKKFNCNISFKKLLKEDLLSIYVSKIIDLSRILSEINDSQDKLLNKKNLEILLQEKANLKKDIEMVVDKYFHDSVEYNILLNFYDYNNKRKIKDNDFENFTKMLHFQKPDIIIEKMKAINYENLLSVFNLWLSEIRYIGEILPNQQEMFDLIIIDEASQVNIAEIFPVLYRGKSVCIVGDEKQLGLNSSGLNFMIGKKEEQHIWDKYLGREMSYDNAQLRELLVTQSSILEMITSKYSNKNYNKVMLDEHYRSMPQLAHYTNKKFYNEELKIMTDTPERATVNCFQSFQVDGKKEKKRNIPEVLKVIEIIKHIHDLEKCVGIEKSPYCSDKSIGIISLLREQVECIKEELLSKNSKLNLVEENDYFILNDCRIKCGTPEELQGDEFDYVIFSATVDSDTRNHAHYNNENRLNVATSRAKYFTYFIYSDVARIPFFASYLRHFGVKVETEIKDDELLGWTYCKNNFESQFEEYIAYVLKDIINNNSPKYWKLFNQVNFAKKRIDFVILNEINKKFVAIEVDGQFHFKNSNSRVYSEEHNERMDLLTRAGWKVVNTPYFAWFRDGFIDENSEDVKNEKQRLNEAIRNLLI